MLEISSRATASMPTGWQRGARDLELFERHAAGGHARRGLQLHWAKAGFEGLARPRRSAQQMGAEHQARSAKATTNHASALAADPAHRGDIAHLGDTNHKG